MRHILNPDYHCSTATKSLKCPSYHYRNLWIHENIINKFSPVVFQNTDSRWGISSSGKSKDKIYQRLSVLPFPAKELLELGNI